MSEEKEKNQRRLNSNSHITKEKYAQSITDKKSYEKQRKEAARFLSGKRRSIDASLFCEEVSDEGYQAVHGNRTLVFGSIYEIPHGIQTPASKHLPKDESDSPEID